MGGRGGFLQKHSFLSLRGSAGQTKRSPALSLQPIRWQYFSGWKEEGDGITYPGPTRAASPQSASARFIEIQHMIQIRGAHRTEEGQPI